MLRTSTTPCRAALERRTIQSMWLRRGFFGWLIPAAFVLPLWLFVGWLIAGAGGWAFLWMIFAIPGVFLWQLLISLLVRARGTVRAHRAVSWWDVLGLTVWHLMIISLGFYNQAWWTPLMILTVLVGVALFWLALWQLWSEAKPSRMILRTSEGMAYIPPAEERAEASVQDIIVVAEKQRPPVP
jgi:hypothetical protein